MKFAEMQALAMSTWGEHPLHWPVPPRRRPRLWHFRSRRSLRDLEAVFGQLDNEALLRWWIQCRKGQSVYEDAGGYFLRCYAAMAGEAVDEPFTYAEAARAIHSARAEFTIGRFAALLPREDKAGPT